MSFGEGRFGDRIFVRILFKRLEGCDLVFLLLELVLEGGHEGLLFLDL